MALETRVLGFYSILLMAFFLQRLDAERKPAMTIQIAIIEHTGSEDFNELNSAIDFAREDIGQIESDLNLSFEETRMATNMRNSCEVFNKFCEKLNEHGIHAVVVLGPESSTEAIRSYVKNENVRLPLFLPTAIGNISCADRAYQINMMPSYVKAMVDVVHFNKWQTLHYIFDSDEGLHRLQEVYSASSDLQGLGNRFTIRPRRITNITDSYELLRSIDRSDMGGDMMRPPRQTKKRIILDLSSKKAYNETLEQIINVGMNRDTYHYIIGGLGITELDLSSFVYGGVNITGFSIINKASTTYRKLIRMKHKRELYQNVYPTYRQALVIDTLWLIQKGFLEVHREQGYLSSSRYNLGCNRANSPGRREYYPSAVSERERNRDRVLQTFKSTRLKADESLTGTLAFDSNGLRTDYTLNVYQQEYKRPLRKVGTWSPNGPTLKDRFQTTLPSPVHVVARQEDENRTLRVVTLMQAPYTQWATFNKNDEDTYRHWIDGRPIEGYCIDVAEKVKMQYEAKFKTKFNFKIHLVNDSQFGSVNSSTAKWNGMVGELIRGEADLAIASLTINKERERVVDFTKPFLKLGISIMIKKPEKQKPGVFSFMSPLDNKVWICVMIAFLAVSVVLFFVGRWSPYEWQKADSAAEDQAINAFTFSNTLWFALGALMQQGSDIFPRSFSGRIVGSAWWFFTLILISSYTANLAAFLTIERLVTAIKSADDLAKQTEIEYGTYEGGATQRFFEESKVLVYQKMWRYMQSHWDRVMVATNEYGIQKVRESKGKYAFLCESPLNNYESQRQPCNTMKVGNNLDNKGYGIATPQKSKLRKKLNIVVLELRELGEFHKLEQKWWYDKGECGTTEGKDGKKNALTLSNVSGIFHILIGGLVMSMIAALLEYLAHRHRKREKQKKSNYKPTSVKIVKKDPLEVLKAAGYTEHENSGV